MAKMASPVVCAELPMTPFLAPSTGRQDYEAQELPPSPLPKSQESPKSGSRAPQTPPAPRLPVAAKRQTTLAKDRIPQQSATDETYKSLSMSSAGGSSFMTHMSSIDLEKSNEVRDKAPTRSSRGSEMAMNHTRVGLQQPMDMRDTASVAYSEQDEEGDVRMRQEDKSVKILLFLSGPCVLLSFLNMCWACISLFITTLTQPVRLCAKRPTFAQQLTGLLGPALNLQLRMIHTPISAHVGEDSVYRTFSLVMVHILSPLLSLGMMMVAWVLAVYWASSAVVGDPAGMDKRDDGREAVLWLRAWWERWLLRSYKQQ